MRDVALNRLLSDIRQRPLLYFGKKNLTCLANYMYGWIDGRGCVSECDYLRDFGEWIKAKRGRIDSHGWAQTILRISGRSEAKAFDRFFVLMQEYDRTKKRRGRGR